MLDGGRSRWPDRAPSAPPASTTSDLSIDEEFTLHSIGWEPLELVCGVSLYAVPMGVWNWGQGEITSASAAYNRSFATAADRMHKECAQAGGHGVVGVHVERSVHRNHIDVALVGTAVRPVGVEEGRRRFGLRVRPVRSRLHPPPRGRLGSPGPGRGGQLRLRPATDRRVWP